MGAFGKVKAMTHKHNGCPVAVKVMNHKRIETQKMTEKVKREIGNPQEVFASTRNAHVRGRQHAI